MDRRPRPQPDDVSRFYWEGAAAGRLLLQRCRSCQQMQFPPDVCCVHCQSDQSAPAEVSGRGNIYTFALVERPLHAGFVDSVPYVVALVELEEQPQLRLATNVVDTPPERIYCGMPVTVVFEERGDVTMPQFRATAAAVGSA